MTVKIAIRHERRNPWTYAKLPDAEVVIEAPTEDEAFKRVYLEVFKRHRYCNNDHFRITDDEVRERYNQWSATNSHKHEDMF